MTARVPHRLSCPSIPGWGVLEAVHVRLMKERGWPTDDIEYWFKDIRDDEPNSEEEEVPLGGPPMPADPPTISGIMLHTHSPSVHVALLHIYICAVSVGRECIPVSYSTYTSPSPRPEAERSRRPRS